MSGDENESLEMEPNEMKDALVAIVQEIQKFSATSINNNFEENDIDPNLQKLNYYKNNLKLKRKLIEKLQKNLKTACIITKTIMSAKESEILSLVNRLKCAVNANSDLSNKNRELINNVKQLIVDNQNYSNKLNTINNFISLRYDHLEFMADKREFGEISTITKLKYIINYCDNNYRNYYNEHEKCKQLEQKNRFLQSKLNILANNLNTNTEQLLNIRYINSKLLRQNEIMRDAKILAYKKDENVKKQRIPLNRKRNKTYQKDGNRHLLANFQRNLNISSHITLINNLLHNQDNMLKNLRELTEEFDLVNPLSCG